MSISISHAPSAAFAEPSRAIGVLPSHIQNTNHEIVRLLKDYYTYLNDSGNASAELNAILKNHDISEASEKYLDELQKIIAPSIPANSLGFDRRRLLNVIYSFYKLRGSEDAIYVFFRLFFNEIVSISYPKSYIFNTSDTQSKTSDVFVLQDGDYYQRFSYIINSQVSTAAWRNSFLKLVHPAGLKLIVAFTVILFNYNSWENTFETYINNILDLSPEEYWENINWDALIGTHSPKFQPGGFRYYYYVFTNIIDELTGYRSRRGAIPTVAERDLFAALIQFVYNYVIIPENSRESIFRTDYQNWLKYFDSSEIGTFSNLTIEDASEEYSPENVFRMNSLGAYSEIVVV